MKQNKLISVVTVFFVLGLTLVVYYLHDDKGSALARVVRSAQQGVLFDKAMAVVKRQYTDILDQYLYADVESDDWRIESYEDRARLPDIKIIKAAPLGELTPAQGALEESTFRNWHRSHGDSSSSRFSSLTGIDRNNVSQLEVAWIFRSGTGNQNIQSNPVIADGLLFTPTGGHDIVALDAATGTQAWSFNPGFDFPAKRGLVWWPGSSAESPRVYFPAGDRIFALSARTGELVAGFSGGSVKIGSNSKIAPVIAGDVLVTASVKPAVHGYHVVTGEHLWTTDLVEDNPPRGPGGQPSKLSGGNPWGGMSLDEDRGIAFIATGNPGPVLVGSERPGDNRYSVSVIAIDVKDGDILWDFQEIPHDLWDLDLSSSPVLTTIERDGRRVDVVAAVTKAGNTLLLDRVSGRPIFDYHMRRAPSSSLPGERTAPYQPDLEYPEPFSKQAFGLVDVTDIGEENRRFVLEQLDNKNYGFFVPHEEGVDTVYFGLHGGAEWPGAASDPRTGMLYVASNHAPSMTTVINTAGAPDEFGLPVTPGREVYLERCVACHGPNREGGLGPSLVWLNLRYSKLAVTQIVRNGQQAMPAVADISNGNLDALLGYLFTRDESLRDSKNHSRRSGDFKFVKTGYRKLVDHEGYPGSAPPWGTLNAINLNTGRIAWRVPLGEYPELSARGIPVTGTENFSGPLVTAGGLVFASGTEDRLVRAFNSGNGEELWRHELPFIGSAPPSTYLHEGRQFLVLPATGGGTLKLYDDSIAVGDAIVAFALPR